ncbi:hypothetical protein ACWEVP_37470 [Amycolatopsis sp. NPDC003865]
MDGDSAVYVIAGGAKFWVPSPQELFAMGDDWGKVQHVAPHDLDRFGAMPERFTYLREWDRPEVWVITGGTAVWVPSPAALFALGVGWDSVRIIPSGALARNGIATRTLPSASATPSSMIFGPNGDGSDAGTRWPRSETPGVSLPNTSHVVDLRGWLADVPDPPLANGDPDVHYGLLLDVDWLLANGYDLRTFVTAIDVVARAWGGGDAHAVASTLQLKIEINGLPTDLGPKLSSRAPVCPDDWFEIPELGQPRVLWPYPIPIVGADGTPLRNGEYVRVCGSLVTDPAHIGGSGTSASYNDAATIWQGAEQHTSPSNPARWTEVHPPDLIQRVSDLPPNQQNTPGTSTLWGVAVCCESFVLSPVPVFNELAAELKPLSPQPPDTIANAQEFVGPETVFSSLVEGNEERTGARITLHSDHVDVYVKVRGQPFHGAPGKFKAAYRVFWDEAPR